VRDACDIIILTMNNYRFTKACLESLFSCDAGYPFSVYILDNASTDSTPDNLAKDFPQVKVWRSDTNLGFAGGNNIILDRTSSRFACLLNNDTIVTAGWLKEMVSAMNISSQVGIVGCRGNNANTEESPEQAVGLEGMKLEELDMNRLHHAARKLSHESKRFTKANKVVGYCMLLRRSMLREIGLLDTRFWPGNFEDNDICCRAMEAGYKIVVSNRSLVYHFVSTTFRQDEEAWHRLFAVNKRFFDFKWSDTGRIDCIGTNLRDRLRVAMEIPKDTPSAEKILAICKELRVRGALVHTFGQSGIFDVMHVCSQEPEKRYGDSHVVFHCPKAPSKKERHGTSRVHVHLVFGDGRYNPCKRHYKLRIGRRDDWRFSPKSVSVQWREKVNPDFRQALYDPPEEFHDMVDRIEEYIRILQGIACDRKHS